MGLSEDDLRQLLVRLNDFELLGLWAGLMAELNARGVVRSEYVQAALHSLVATDLESVFDEAKRERLRWALAYAESLDPLRRA